MATQLNARALTTNEQAGNGGYTHIVVVDHTNLTETTTNTAQTFNVAPTLAGDTIVKYAMVLKTPLKDASDSAFNSNTLSFGDSSSATRFVSGVQANENGTEVTYTFGNTAYTYTAAGQLTITVNSMSAKALSDVDTGQVIFMFELLRHSALAAAVGSI